MSTFLFDKIVFGPVKSRRLGKSLGVNILYNNAKLCNFDCIYCECGWSLNIKGQKLPTVEQVTVALETKIKNISEAEMPDVITFAGNGEPTLHPNFYEIIDNAIKIRNTYVPNVKITVLTNATQLHKQKVVDALKKIDLPILKIDTVIQSDFELINRCSDNVSILKIMDSIITNFKNPIIQTMFFKVQLDNYLFDNTRKDSLQEYFNALNKIQPNTVMLYSVDRDTPMQGLEKIDFESLQLIANEIEKLGFKTTVTP